MSKEFIEGNLNKNHLATAVRQYKQLIYFIESEVAEDVREEYFQRFVESKYTTSDVFLNWVKLLFKNDNFTTFAKYYKNPNPSSKLINNRIKPNLSRVFFAEDSSFKYIVNDEYVESPKVLDDDFDKDLFKAILFRYNDVIIHDLNDVNSPYREIVCIDRVNTIDVQDNKIKRISYSAKTEFRGEMIYGYAYLDGDKYAFYDSEKNLLFEEEHDLGYCPAVFVTNQNFGTNEIVKESIFSYVRADLEEYCFLKTLQRMVDANGTVPVVIKMKTNEVHNNAYDAEKNHPMSANAIMGQKSSEAVPTAKSAKGNVLSAGTMIESPIIEKDDGSIDTTFAKNFLTFHYAPTEALEFLDKRIKSVEKDIINNCIGDYSDINIQQGSKSDSEIKSNDLVSKQDKLRQISDILSYTRKNSDAIMLRLAHGRNAYAEVFYGSDFFLESQSTLYDLFEKSPNAIERKNILMRLIQRRNVYNKEKSKKEIVLYKLLPYASDIEFNKAVEKDMVRNEVFELQTRFNYWIAIFEAQYGDVCIFWDNLEGKESVKIVTINSLLYELINNYLNQ